MMGRWKDFCPWAEPDVNSHSFIFSALLRPPPSFPLFFFPCVEKPCSSRVYFTRARGESSFRLGALLALSNIALVWTRQKLKQRKTCAHFKDGLTPGFSSHLTWGFALFRFHLSLIHPSLFIRPKLQDRLV
ncbi:hypothetical protein IE53DRAFT_6721 [Violaceomyces palustris]|uniref:Uncharacterized protein n=1 Tax=Violaceomyces palustris TaxID=1673888 RepID=A0ACD0NLX3_9BASI|nr:hypothetical protein IE53DRAFT_6721 [Violaceomyces palustris]